MRLLGVQLLVYAIGVALFMTVHEIVMDWYFAILAGISMIIGSYGVKENRQDKWLYIVHIVLLVPPFLLAMIIVGAYDLSMPSI